MFNFNIIEYFVSKIYTIFKFTLLIIYDLLRMQNYRRTLEILQLLCKGLIDVEKDKI